MVCAQPQRYATLGCRWCCVRECSVRKRMRPAKFFFKAPGELFGKGIVLDFPQTFHDPSERAEFTLPVCRHGLPRFSSILNTVANARGVSRVPR